MDKKASKFISDKAAYMALFHGWSFDKCIERWPHLTMTDFCKALMKMPYSSRTRRTWVKLKGKRYYQPRIENETTRVYFNNHKTFYNESDDEMKCGTQDLHAVFAKYKYDRKMMKEEVTDKLNQNV